MPDNDERRRPVEGQWDASDLPSQAGRVAVVTGANSGIGFETARQLGRAGARVILVCRDGERGQQALRQLIESVDAASGPEPVFRLELADMADLTSVSELSARLHQTEERIDLLINNAGIMAVPHELSPDGIELQLATNHVGHFALTARIWDLLESAVAPLAGEGGGQPGLTPRAPSPGEAEARPPRVVNVSSLAHRPGRFDFDDMALEGPHAYTPMGAYRRSKLANLLFTYELERRCDQADVAILATAAHPGLTRTKLFGSGDRPFYYTLVNPVFNALAQGPRMGAQPTLRAAVDPHLAAGTYVGPADWGETRGRPVPVKSSARSHDRLLAHRLWEWTENVTGLHLLS